MILKESDGETVTITFRLKAEEVQTLDQIAKQDERTRGNLLAKIVRAYIKEVTA